MWNVRVFSLALCLFGVALAAVGCGPSMRVFLVDDGSRWIEDDWEEGAVKVADKAPEIALKLVVPAAHSCIFKTENDPAKAKRMGIEGAYYVICTLSALPPGDAEQLEAAVKKAFEQAQAAAPKELDKMGYVTEGTLVTGLGAIAKEVLTHRLSERFSKVTVDLVTEKPADAGLAVSVSTELVIVFGPEKRTLIRLVAETGAGEPLVAEGYGLDRAGGGHLAGMLVVAILGFPISLAFITGVWGPALHDNTRAASVARALDQASKDLAAKLAQKS